MTPGSLKRCGLTVEILGGMKRLGGKVAIVTGAGSGIGEATVRLMSLEGASVVVADLDRVEADRVAGELDRAVPVEVDVSTREASCA